MSRLSRFAAPYLALSLALSIVPVAASAASAPPLPATSAAQNPPAPAAPRKPNVKKPRAKTLTLHGVVKSVKPGALIVSGTGNPDLSVTLTKRGRALRSGKPAAIGDFPAGEAIMIRGRQAAPDGFTATLIMDAASEKMASLARRAPILKIANIDPAKGEVTLQSVNGDLFIRVLTSRIRVGRKEIGATAGLQTGQIYRARLTNGPDAEPALSLTLYNAAAPKATRKRSAPKTR
ncbi:MAG TPA: hypothetical protein VFJ58_11005 [Armatimonadota bacterium]|nr:hypothetical protein [Armatimonadota bacterium]